jgi:hypothetical protein
MSCWTVFHYVTAPARAAVHHTAHIARHVGKAAHHAIRHSGHIAAAHWKTTIVCTVVGGIGGAVGGAHLVGVPFPPVSGQQLVQALGGGGFGGFGGFGGGPGGGSVGPAGERREATWASGVTGFAGYPDRPVRRVPEPSSALILLAGASAIVVLRKRKCPTT